MIPFQEAEKYVKDYTTTRYVLLDDYYKAKHNILSKTTDPYKPNNKIVNNFAKYITDVNVGYLLGKPVSYSVTDTDQDLILEEIKNIFNYNDEQAENSILAKQASIKGKVFELLYVDEEGKVRFNMVPAENIIVFYDDSITPNYKGAIRFSKGITDINDVTDKADQIMFMEIYDEISVERYVNKNGTLVLTDTIQHPFGDVPVIEYDNNDEKLGDFEGVIALIDAYNKAQSETADDYEYFADAYLLIKNMSGTTSDDIADMRKNRSILVDGDGDAKFLIKQTDGESSENYKTRIQEDIHRFSMTPNLTDESFAGNISGLALEFKLWGLEQLAAQKERLFKKGLQRRLELLAKYFAFYNREFRWIDVEISFKRNMPMNVSDIVDMVVKLKGIISDETLIAQLPFIENPAEELKKLALETSDYIDLDEDMNTEVTEEVPTETIEETTPQTEQTEVTTEG